MTLEVVNSMTDSQLKDQLEFQFHLFKGVRHKRDSNEYFNWLTDYKKLHFVFEQRNLLNVWNEMVANFEAQYPRKESK